MVCIEKCEQFTLELVKLMEKYELGILIDCDGDNLYIDKVNDLDYYIDELLAHTARK